ncbi:uncharacterized protein LOC129761290 [Toxorhynchites rutilus septentrionalis]|uniref:uncharacterized protein LOC129761290 n=1 Tax=Toxorhynchites rutilus septentrionalis TaxID=329112 RepID=UPI002479FE3E|nr:uncharacterized protein LOC129761290 [Toxorhynchites rutilus septentrionalis]
MPFKENTSDLNDCRTLALEKRLARDTNLRDQYKDFIHEYETLGHCEEVEMANETSTENKYYLPHHAVLRPSSSSTKCRVVFDASAKSSPADFSLNDVLMVGSVVQSDLFSIILRFRKYNIRTISSQPLLDETADDEAVETPTAAHVLREDFYIDDALSGADTIHDAVDIQLQLQLLLCKGGFAIHKWCSNSDEFLSNIPEEFREKQMPIPEYEANGVIKLLGLLWDPQNDLFFIANPFRQETTNDTISNRSIYSEISKLFDPIGLLAPVIVTAKLLVQQLRKAKLEWNEPVNNEWMDLETESPLLTRINVPRRVTFDNVVSYSLYGFADTSSVAYGAYIYLRNEFADGSAKLR